MSIPVQDRRTLSAREAEKVNDFDKITQSIIKFDFNTKSREIADRS